MSNLLVFPGQGSQFIGMGEDFAKNFKVSKNVYSKKNFINFYKVYISKTSLF